MDVNQQQWTMNRAAYGDNPAAMMAASGGGMGYPGGGGDGTTMFPGIGDPLAAIGRTVRPVAYVPPAMVNTGYYGMTRMEGGLFRSAFHATGITTPPRSMFSYDFQQRYAADFGERVGGGLVGGGIAAASTIGGLALGAGVSMAGGGLIASMAPMLALGAAGSAVQTAIAQRREISGFLETNAFRFVGPGSSMADPRTGTGMSIGARREVTEFIRTREKNEPLLNMDDMTNILKGAVSNNLLTGTKDVEDFKKKFKDIVDSVKLVTKTLNTTLDEGMKVMKDLRTAGITDPTQIRTAVTTADWTGRMAGRTGAEMVGLGLQGAEMFRGTGISMNIGMQANMMNLANIRALRDAKLLSDEAVAQAGGEEAMAQQQTARGLSFAQSAVGRGLNAAFYNPMAGGFNAQSFQAMAMRGGGSLVGLATQAAYNLASPSAMIGYQANQAKMVSEMGKTFGGQGLQIAQDMTTASQALYLAQATGAKREDALRYMYQQQGMSEPEIEKRIASMKGAGEVYQAANEAARQTQNRLIAENSAQNVPVRRFIAAVSKTAEEAVDVVAKPMNEVIDRVKESAIGWFETTWKGTRTVDLKKTYTAISPESRRELSPKERLEQRVAEERMLGSVDIEKVGGRVVAENIEKIGADKLGIKTQAMSREQAEREGRIILDSSTFTGLVTTITREDQKRLNDYTSKAVTLDDAKKMAEAGKLKDLRTRTGQKVRDMWTIIAEGGTAKFDTMEAASQAFFGKKETELTKEERAYIRNQVESTDLGKKLAKEDEAITSQKGMTDQLSIADIEKFQSQRKETMTRLSKKVRGTLTEEVAGILADAASITVNTKEAHDAKNKLLAKAMQKYSAANEGKSVEQVQKDITILEADNAAELKDFRAQSIGIEERQKSISAGLFTRTAQLELGELKGISSRQASSALVAIRGLQTAIGTSPEELIAKLDRLGQEDRAVLERTATGGEMIRMGKTMRELQKAESIEDKDEKNKAISEAIKKSGIAGSKEMAAQVMTGTLSGDAASRALLETYSKQGAGTTLQQGAGGGAVTTAEGAAGKSMEQQMLINQQVLQAMTALATKMGMNR